MRRNRRNTKVGVGARLGQHFLTGVWAAKRLAESVQVRPGETILEIGPGKGALTRELLIVSARVVAVEKDEALAVQLKSTCASEIASGALTIISGDIRDFNPMRSDIIGEGYVVAANIPYYITGEIIRQFLTADIQPRSMVLLVQKEVAERIMARDKKESILSLSVKVYGTPKIVAKVSRGNFSPPPSVDSAILLVSDISKKSFFDIGEDVFFKVVKSGFASKRKFLASNLGNQFEKEVVARAFAECALPPTIRAEDVSLEEWKSLTKVIERLNGEALQVSPKK